MFDFSELKELIRSRQGGEREFVTAETVGKGHPYPRSALTVLIPSFGYRYSLEEGMEVLHFYRVHLDDPGDFRAMTCGSISSFVSSDPVKGFDYTKLLNWLDNAIAGDITATFKAEISSWDWDGIKRSAIEGNGEDREGLEFLGAVMALAPSGKFYTAWANSNVGAIEANVDTCFWEALDSVAEEQGGWIERGEGDPCDVFFGIFLEVEGDE
jgi:hypothetical protein